MKVAVIGIGYVGKAVTKMLMVRYDVLAKDVNFEVSYEAATGTATKKVVLASNYDNIKDCIAAIVCVPTAMNGDGSCDTSIVEFVVGQCPCKYILIKSTVPPGTTQRLIDKYLRSKQIAFSPEYLGESSYFTPYWKYPHPSDLRYHDFQIFGGDKGATNFFVELFQKIMGPSCRYFQTDATTAEVTKYMENAWGALKVTFVNEFYRIAELFGVDFREVRELWLLDGRIERAHTSVFEGNFGFGGKCLPKDLEAIICACRDSGYMPELLGQVLRSNATFRSHNSEEGE